MDREFLNPNCIVKAQVAFSHLSPEALALEQRTADDAPGRVTGAGEGGVLPQRGQGSRRGVDHRAGDRAVGIIGRVEILV